MFYVELRDAEGRLNGVRVDRLKDKLGTRKVPTAELTLDGMLATLIGQPRNGTRAIEPMLGVTRMWNSICAAAFMRRGVALARAYATRREAFGERLDQLPLHVDTLAMLEAETWGAFLMAFQLVELHGKLEAGEIDDEERALLRLVTPLTKLATGKQAVATVSEVSRVSAARGTSRTPVCRSSCAIHRCCPSGRARRTCCRSTRCCARTSTRPGRAARPDLDGRLRPQRHASCRSRPSGHGRRRARGVVDGLRPG
jgi:alkylation response protein AidB-like acyl-CoA dehydrogenase